MALTYSKNLQNTAEIFLSPDEIPRRRRRSRRFSSFQITRAAIIWQLSVKKNYILLKESYKLLSEEKKFWTSVPL